MITHCGNGASRHHGSPGMSPLEHHSNYVQRGLRGATQFLAFSFIYCPIFIKIDTKCNFLNKKSFFHIIFFNFTHISPSPLELLILRLFFWTKKKYIYSTFFLFILWINTVFSLFQAKKVDLPKTKVSCSPYGVLWMNKIVGWMVF